MPPTTISLNRLWKMAGQFDSGGFATVYEAEADDGSPAVLKLVPKAAGADRELLFEELSGLPNIIPILDTGEWEDYYVLAMPRAEKSLRKHLEDNGGQLAVDEARAVLVDIAETLSSLEAEVVHRDLKPENVLLYEGKWCLADFGIARYAEASTAADTRKYSMTPPYAAPEQWRSERASSATDVYALGIMAFELLQGERPFPGPDFRQQHLEVPAPSVDGCPPSLASLVSECLYKPAAARPTPANILARLQSSHKTSSPSIEKLQDVQMAVAEKRGEEAAQASAQQSREVTRQELLHVGQQSLQSILDTLRDRALEGAPATQVSTSGGGLLLKLANGVLGVDEVQTAPADCLAAFDYDAPFDVIAYAAIAARKPRDRYDYEGRAHSLWFCDAHDAGIYRWYEVAFMVSPLIGQRSTLDPFALPPMDEYAGSALAPVTDVRQIAWQPVPFDQGEEEQFIERWLGWFAAAADESLSHPRSMPEDSGGRFRAPVPAAPLAETPYRPL